MTEEKWETIKITYCNRAEAEVTLEAQVVYPPEFMPEQPPRIVAHRCSFGVDCNLMDKPTCIWAGTNPAYDPFA